MNSKREMWCARFMQPVCQRCLKERDLNYSRVVCFVPSPLSLVLIKRNQIMVWGRDWNWFSATRFELKKVDAIYFYCQYGGVEN
jgi:hypothetical protein